LAAALGMNYGFGVEFVEVDPINLGLEKFEELPAEAGDKLTREIHVNQTRYKGLHGTAILSRFYLGECAARTIRAPAARLVSSRAEKREAA
jgi:hypothetical protein